LQYSDYLNSEIYIHGKNLSSLLHIAKSNYLLTVCILKHIGYTACTNLLNTTETLHMPQVQLMITTKCTEDL